MAGLYSEPKDSVGRREAVLEEVWSETAYTVRAAIGH